MAQKIKVAVIGAGIAGLTAAYRLQERGCEVAIFESRIHVGGKLGAHPRRISVDPRPSKPAPKAAYQKQIEEWSIALDDGKLPGDLKKEVDTFLRKQRVRYRPQRVSDDSAAMYDSPLIEKLDIGSDVKPRPHHHAIRGWRVKDEKNRYKFNIWIHKNEWGILRVEITDDVYHEHCYHMYLNWYHNFWQLMRDIGCERTEFFTPLNEVAHLFPGATAVDDRLRTLTSIGSLDSLGDNLLSGVASVPDMFLWFYSNADLVSEPFQPGRYLDWTSVHGFLRSRWYVTEQNAMLHEYVLSKAFAIPTYLTSAYAYRSYIEYGVIEPEPMLWVLKGNSHEALFVPFIKKICFPSSGEPCDLKLGRMVTGFKLDVVNGTECVVGLKYRPADMRDAAKDDEAAGTKAGRSRGIDDPDPDDDGERSPESNGPEQIHTFLPDYVILAVPPKALATLAGPHRERLPSLNAVRKLQSGVTAALDLHFTRRLPGIPKQHVILRGSRFGLTFFDNSQAWANDDNLDPNPDKQRGGNCTCLSVAATDFYKIAGMDKRSAARVMIDDLKRFIDFEDSDIDLSKTYLQMNDGEPMFLNEVGSEPWRPGPRTEIPNLFVAGDFCDNEIGIVSVEGAVVSGLLAARALQARARDDHNLPADDALLRPIPILSPDRYPRMNAHALKLALTPFAAVAKAWSRAEEFARHPERAVTPREAQATIDDTLAAPGQITADWFSLAREAAQWSAELPFHDEE